MPVDKTPSEGLDVRQFKFLHTPFGEPFSGRTRYAAAMYFYQQGFITSECLEVYRTCSPIDHEDPAPTLIALGLLHEIEALKSTFSKSTRRQP